MLSIENMNCPPSQPGSCGNGYSFLLVFDNVAQLTTDIDGTALLDLGLEQNSLKYITNHIIINNNCSITFIWQVKQ